MGKSTLGKMAVRDTAIFDKPVIIKDSVTLERKLTVDQDMKIKGEAVFVGKVKAKTDLKILGVTKMKGDAFVEGDFKFKGLQDFNLSDERFLMIKPNGKAVSMEKAGLVEVMYEPRQCIPFNGVYPAPTWSNMQGTGGNPGVLYTANNCPGNVGIGTDSPLGKLDVRGTTYLSGATSIGIAPNSLAQLYVNQNNPSIDGLTVEFTSTSSTVSGVGIKTIVDNDDRHALAVFNTEHNRDVFRVLGNGNVWATEVHIRLKEDFPDYVFSDTYNLLSIEELENFINDNSHLPNLPTAKEVSESGLDLGEMNRLLVEKVEELSLYVIDLQKQVNELKK
jgi:hypothetical protein